MTSGTYTCDICGLDTPHSHKERDVWIERYGRPAFERWFREQPQHSYYREILRMGYRNPTGEQGMFQRQQGLGGRYAIEIVETHWEAWATAWLCLPDRAAADEGGSRER